MGRKRQSESLMKRQWLRIFDHFVCKGTVMKTDRFSSHLCDFQYTHKHTHTSTHVTALMFVQPTALHW